MGPRLMINPDFSRLTHPLFKCRCNRRICVHRVGHPVVVSLQEMQIIHVNFKSPLTRVTSWELLSLLSGRLRLCIAPFCGPTFGCWTGVQSGYYGTAVVLIRFPVWVHAYTASQFRSAQSQSGYHTASQFRSAQSQSGVTD